MLLFCLKRVKTNCTPSVAGQTNSKPSRTIAAFLSTSAPAWPRAPRGIKRQTRAGYNSLSIRFKTINQPDDPPPRVTLTALSHSALHKTTSTWWHASDLACIALSAGSLMSHDTNGAPGIPLPRLLSSLLSPLSEALLGSSRQSAGCAPSAQHYPASAAATVRTRAAIPLRTLPPGSAGWSGTTPG